MYEEYQKRGGRLSREEFDAKLTKLAKAISAVFYCAPPLEKLREEAFESLCRTECHPCLK
jgi:hypothetical protein